MATFRVFRFLETALKASPLIAMVSQLMLTVCLRTHRLLRSSTSYRQELVTLSSYEADQKAAADRLKPIAVFAPDKTASG